MHNSDIILKVMFTVYLLTREHFLLFPKKKEESIGYCSKLKYMYNVVSSFKNAESYQSYCLSSTDRNTCTL